MASGLNYTRQASPSGTFYDGVVARRGSLEALDRAKAEAGEQLPPAVKRFRGPAVEKGVVMMRSDGRNDGPEPRILGTLPISGGNRKLVYSQCAEYLVIDQIGGRIESIQVFQANEYPAAAAAFADFGGKEDEKSTSLCGKLGGLLRGGLPAVPCHAMGLPQH